MADDGIRLALAAELTMAWLSNPHTRAHADDVSAMLGSMHSALGTLAASEPTAEPTTEAPNYTAAVSVRKSLASPDHIISMIDGKPYRTLTRHLGTHGLTPDEYRQRYGLKSDYPMTAPTYSASRSAAAKQHNFGRVPAIPLADEAVPTPQPAPEPVQAAAPKGKRVRKSAARAKRDAQAHLGAGEAGTGPAPAKS